MRQGHDKQPLGGSAARFRTGAAAWLARAGLVARAGYDTTARRVRTFSASPMTSGNAGPPETDVELRPSPFLYLSVGLVAGAVIEMFGLRWQAMIQGLAFMSHQLGSFVGAFGGGLLFDAYGSYDLAWRLGVGMGLVAGAVQIAFALARPPRLATT